MLIHMTRSELQPGDLIAPGNWGAVIRQQGEAHGAWLRECVLEGIRELEFPSKPSRMATAFAFVDLASALWWWRHERQKDFIYEVEVVDGAAASHIGDLLGVQMVPAVDVSPEAAARRYWSRGTPHFNTPDGVFIDELVTLSPLKVVGRLPVFG